jgi:glutathione synthase
MKIGFVMDPIEKVNVFADTTFAMMLAAQARGHEVYYIRPGDLAAENNEAWAVVQHVELRQDPNDPVSFGAATYEPLHVLDVVWMRKDPPFDVPYLYEVALLELAGEHGCFIMNSPHGLRAANEKLYSLHFPEVIPDTLVTNLARRIKDFMADHGGKAVLKPLGGHGGEGIFVVDQDDRNINVILELSTAHQSRHIMCQAYVPDARLGDKRIIMLDGKPLGAILRVPLESEHRSNIHVGGKVEKTELTERDLEICNIVGPRLKQDGLYFVGLDVIGGYLTEVNVTSPTGIQEMSRLNGVDGAGMVIEWIEERVVRG